MSVSIAVIKVSAITNLGSLNIGKTIICRNKAEFTRYPLLSAPLPHQVYGAQLFSYTPYPYFYPFSYPYTPNVIAHHQQSAQPSQLSQPSIHLGHTQVHAPR